MLGCCSAAGLESGMEFDALFLERFPGIHAPR